ncbi:MAG: protein-glutamate O-methyltransferase CheR [bacterium]
MTTLTGVALTAGEFQTICALMYRVSGVNLTEGKEGLVASRLSPRLRHLQLDSYRDYIAHIARESNHAELTMFVDLLTTNKTAFFREPQHFEYLRQDVLPRLHTRGGDARFWCAACSSGEEPYTLAMLIAEEWSAPGSPRARILATDLSTRVLAKATAAEYDETAVGDIDRSRVARHMEVVTGARPRRLRVRKPLRDMVQVARLNLMERAWPMRGPFDVIMCRNVMIYFDVATQERLVNRFWDLLAPGGSLLVGHSESLSAVSHEFSYAKPATYIR